MHFQLQEEPSKPIIICGNPGFGMISLIVSEYLIDHLKMRQIGKVLLETIPAVVPFHKGKPLDPIGIYYNDAYNLVIIHNTSQQLGLDWKNAELILTLAKRLHAWEIVTIDGIIGIDEPQVYSYATHTGAQEKLRQIGILSMSEGVASGTTAALLAKVRYEQLLSLFVTSHTELPDSAAAALIIEALDSYYDLKVDTKPLLQMAAAFEQKLKAMLESSQQTIDEKEKKQMSYVG